MLVLTQMLRFYPSVRISYTHPFLHKPNYYYLLSFFSLIYRIFHRSFFSLLSWRMELKNGSARDFRFAEFVDHFGSFLRRENAVRRWLNLNTENVNNYNPIIE